MDGDLVDMGLDMAELKELYLLNKEKIASFEQDIHQCRQKLKLFGPEAVLTHDLRLTQRSDGSSNLEEIKERLASDILTMEGRVKETAKLTGISIVQVEEHTEMTEDNSKRSLALTLQILDRDVELRCDIDDVASDQREGSGSRRVVSWLEVRIEKDINDVIGDAIAKCTQDVAVHSVLSLIKSYLQCASERDRMIQHFTQTYPNTVSHLIEEQTHKLKIASTYDTRQPTFVLEWELRLQHSTHYTSHVSLKVDASNKLKALDSKGILDSASEMFDHMTLTFGVEKAIDSFVSMVMTDSNGGTVGSTAATGSSVEGRAGGGGGGTDSTSDVH